MAIALQVRDSEGRCHVYAAEQQIKIGRDPSQVNVVLDDEFVSRYHCVIQRRLNGDWVFIHRGRNPSWVDGQDLRRPGEQVILKDRSALRLGGIMIEATLDEDPATQLMAMHALVEEEDDAMADADAGEEVDEDGLCGDTIADASFSWSGEGGEDPADQVLEETASMTLNVPRRQRVALHELWKAADQATERPLESTAKSGDEDVAVLKPILPVPSFQLRRGAGAFLARIWRRFFRRSR